MKVFLLVAFAFLQLLPSGYSDKNFINPPSDSIQHPIYVDNVPQDPNTRHARSTGDDFQAFFDRGVSSIIQGEIHKATQESVDENENSHNDVEHDRFKRNTGPPPRPPPPPPRRPPFITDDIRGFNRRYARDTYLDDQVEQELLRERRDLQIPGYKKPTHHDVVIPNWNPNARTQPWQTIGVRRHRRDLQAVQGQLEKEVPNDFPDHSQIPDNSRRRRGLNQNSGDRGVLINRPRVPRPDSVPRWRNRRDLQIPGYKKPTHHDVIIPNWNPNVRTQPWQHIGRRIRRSYDSRSHASRGTTSSSSSSDTGRTHPGYNRRNA